LECDVPESSNRPVLYPHSATKGCGDFCGDPLFIPTHFNTSQSISPQQAKLLNQKALQGFLSSFQRVSKFTEKGFLNRGSGVRIPPGLPFFSRSYDEPPFSRLLFPATLSDSRLLLEFRLRCLEPPPNRCGSRQLSLVSCVRIDDVHPVVRVSESVHPGLHVHSFVQHERVVQVPKGVPVKFWNTGLASKGFDVLGHQIPHVDKPYGRTPSASGRRQAAKGES